MDNIEIIEKLLVGNFYHRFSVGDTWEFNFDGFKILSYSVVAKEEEQLNTRILAEYPPYKNCVDKEDVAKSIVASASMRSLITRVHINESSELVIYFENQVVFTLPSNTKVVDWQWAITKSYGDPYREFMVGCFGEGDIQFNC